MKQQDAAFDSALSALRRLGLPDILPDLHAAGLGISRTILGGSHSVAVYPPIDSFLPVDAQAITDAIDFGEGTSLYIHIPFCETRCTFCHYAVDHYSGRKDASASATSAVRRYLDALGHEIACWGTRLAGAPISSIYIGGGTPLLLDEQEFSALFTALRDHFNLLDGAEICVEGSPLSITAPEGTEKLRALRALGVTRFSFGVQSFDDAVLRYAGRGYKRDVAIRAATIVRDIFDNWNLDLIQGLYRGSPAESRDNLDVLADLMPAHLTWYHGRFANRPQGDWYQSTIRHAEFEDELETLLGRMVIWQGMAGLGYAQSDGNRFVHESRHVDRFKKIRTSLSNNLLGIGASSYSHVRSHDSGRGNFGYVFRNSPDIGAYIDRINADMSPIVTGRRIDGEELLAMSYATGLRGGRTETNTLASVSAAHPALAADYAARVRMLTDLGVLEAYGQDGVRTGLRLTDLGRLFEDETLALFFSPAVQVALAQKTPRRSAPVPVRAPAFA